MGDDRLYKVALSMVQGSSADLVREMDSRGMGPEEFFKLNMPELSARLDTQSKFENARREEALFKARRELEFVDRHSIRTLFLTDGDYPALLRETPDAPVVLYVLGNADLNSAPAFNVVGTRRCTGYGVSFTRNLVEDLAGYFPDCMVVSGLAYGIDAAAHEAALSAGVATVGVLAHGLDTVYPAAHRDLARRIIGAGGALVSEYPHGSTPYRGNFLQRNRIVAGLCELTVVAESEVKGGAMSTANLAFSYSREVVALPGRFSDSMSSGCNMLIARNKASIFTSVADLITAMRWKIKAGGVSIAPRERNLFPELEPEAADIYNFMRGRGAPVSVDEIHQATCIPMSSLIGHLTELEFEGVVCKLPGSRYELA